jgi:2-methylcitrate dehydratase
MTRTIAELLAAEAKALTFRELPPKVIHQAKLAIVDTLAVAFGAYQSEPSQIVQSMIREMNGPAESTVFGSGLKTSCQHATLVNGVMVRYLDYQDLCFLEREAVNDKGHGCESIPGILAVGERQHSNGQEVITAIVAAYELSIKVGGSMRLRPKEVVLEKPSARQAVLQARGWVTQSLITPLMSLIAGRLLGLNEEQMANALAIAGCFPSGLGILDVAQEELPMVSNLRFSYGAYNALLSALLAQKGFKGQLNVFEGRHGIAEVLGGGEMDFEKLRQPRKDWKILNTWIKNYPAVATSQGMVEATLTCVKEHNIKAEDVAEVRLKTRPETYWRHPTTRRRPTNVETASDSAYYLAAVAILDRALGPEQYSEEKLRDARVLELSDKVVVQIDPKIEGFSECIAEITTKKGQNYQCHVLHPKGSPMNPMTDADVEEKFRSMAGKYFGEKQMTQIIDTILTLEKLDDIGDLLKLLVIPGQTSLKN